MDKKFSFEKDFAYCGRLNSETKCGNLGKVLWFSSNSTYIQPTMHIVRVNSFETTYAYKIESFEHIAA